jgi:hypothetical protein
MWVSRCGAVPFVVVPSTLVCPKRDFARERAALLQTEPNRWKSSASLCCQTLSSIHNNDNHFEGNSRLGQSVEHTDLYAHFTLPFQEPLEKTNAYKKRSMKG